MDLETRVRHDRNRADLLAARDALQVRYADEDAGTAARRAVEMERYEEGLRAHDRMTGDEAIRLEAEAEAERAAVAQREAEEVDRAEAVAEATRQTEAAAAEQRRAAEETAQRGREATARQEQARQAIQEAPPNVDTAGQSGPGKADVVASGRAGAGGPPEPSVGEAVLSQD